MHNISPSRGTQVEKLPFEGDSADPVAVAVVARHAQQTIHDAVRCVTGKAVHLEWYAKMCTACPDTAPGRNTPERGACV